MALATIILRKLSIPKQIVCLPSRFRLKLFSRYSSSSTFPLQSPNSEKSLSATWLQQWDPPPPPPPQEQQTKPIKSPSAIERIVHRLRDLEPELEEDEEIPVKEASALYGNGKMGESLQRNWNRPDLMSSVGKNLSWEGETEMEVRKRRRTRAPTLAELTVEDEELMSLRRLGKGLKEKVTVPKAGLTAAVLDKIHGVWKEKEVVKLKFHEDLAGDMKTAHVLVQNLTGGVLLLRNKYYVVMYRGKDFLPTAVATALFEGDSTRDVPEVEEETRFSSITVPCVEEKGGISLVGTFARFQQSQICRGRKATVQKQMVMKEETSRDQSAILLQKLEHKFAITQSKKLRTVKLLDKIEASMVPINPSIASKMLTDEERSVFRKIGLQMKSYLGLGIRDGFDGIVGNMYLHWKHRELVKLISKQKKLSFVENFARILEYESGGVLIAIERVPKGFALVYYRGKNHKRPCCLRLKSILTKSKALKHVVAIQRHKGYSQAAESDTNTTMIQSDQASDK